MSTLTSIVRAVCTLLAIGLIACQPLKSSAQVNLLNNGGFETTEFDPFATPGWTQSFSDSAVIRILSRGDDPLGPYAGNHYLTVTQNTEISGPFSFTLGQTIATTPGTSYRITLFAKPATEEDVIYFGLGVSWSNQVVSWIDEIEQGDEDNLYNRYSYVVQATSPSTLFQIVTPDGASGDVAIDEVSVVALPGPFVAAPEPGTMALFVAGGLSLGLLGRRRRSN